MKLNENALKIERKKLDEKRVHAHCQLKAWQLQIELIYAQIQRVDELIEELTEK